MVPVDVENEFISDVGNSYLIVFCYKFRFGVHDVNVHLQLSRDALRSCNIVHISAPKLDETDSYVSG